MTIVPRPPRQLDAATCTSILRSGDFDVIDLDAYYAEVERGAGISLPNVRSVASRILFFVRGERHLEMRRGVLDFLQASSVAKWQPVIGDCAEAALEGLEGSAEADLLADYAAPIAGKVLCRMLGLPPERSLDFDRWGDIVPALLEPMLPLRRIQEIESALGDFAAEVASALRGPAPGETRGPTFLHGSVSGLGTEDRIWLAIVLYVAGRSTLHTLANVLQLVGQAPPEKRLVLLDPARRMMAVDRLIARGGSIQFVSRVARRDSVAGGEPVDAGSRIDLHLAAANAETAAGSCPFERPSGRIPPHLAFGAGVHKCPGALLARLIIGQALEALLRHHPGFRLARAPTGHHRSAVVGAPIDLPCILFEEAI